jgi:hypothetical protein
MIQPVFSEAFNFDQILVAPQDDNSAAVVVVGAKPLS